MMGWYGDWDLPALIGMAATLAFWAGLALVVVWAVRAFLPPHHPDGRAAALALLDRRYAAGAITQAEYEQAGRTLGTTSADTP